MKIIPNGVTRAINTQLLHAKKESPRILFVVGVAGVVASTVLACRATLKLPEVLDDFKAEVDSKKELKHEAQSKPAIYNSDKYGRDLSYIYVKNSARIVRLYGPAIIVGTASIAALTTSHVTLSNRNANLTAAYSALQLSFDAYRERIRQEVGKEKELDLYHGATSHTVVIDGETKEVKRVDPNGMSHYSKFFDEASPYWQKDAEHNRIFVQCQQNYANHLLQSRGHVFLNEVYDALGIPRTKAGQVVGWVISKEGDNYIDFGIFEAANADFVNNWERSILLDFNVDGVIYDKI